VPKKPLDVVNSLCEAYCFKLKLWVNLDEVSSFVFAQKKKKCRFGMK